MSAAPPRTATSLPQNGGNDVIRAATRRRHAASQLLMLHPPAGQIGNQRRAYSPRLVPNCGAGGRGQDLAGLQNDADHPPAHQAPPFVEGTARPAEPGRGAGGCRWAAAGHSRALKRRRSPPAHQAPPVWRATRELRDKRGLAVELGGGARGRRGLDGMCTAMKSPTGVEGTGGLGRASRSTTPSRGFTHGGNREARVARGAGPRCRWAAAGPGRASRSTTPSRRLACGDLAGGPPPTGTQRSSPHRQTSRCPEIRRIHNQHPQRNEAATGFRPRPRRAQSVPLSKAAPPAIRRSCPRGPRPRRGQPRGGRRGRGTGSRTRSRHPRYGRSGSTAGRHRARHTRRA